MLLLLDKVRANARRIAIVWGLLACVPFLHGLEFLFFGATARSSIDGFGLCCLSVLSAVFVTVLCAMVAKDENEEFSDEYSHQ